MSRISAAPVERDNLGFWTHPAWPELGDDEGLPKSWFVDHGLEVYVDGLEYGQEEVTDRYFESGDPDCSYWEPAKPDGEGWFVFSIHDTDDGPICVWVRPAPGGAQ